MRFLKNDNYSEPISMLKQEDIIKQQRHWLLLFCLFFSSIGFSQLDTEHFIPPVYASTHIWVGAREQVVYISTPTKTPVNYIIKNGAGVTVATGIVTNATPASFQMNGSPTEFVVEDADLNKVLTDRGLHITSDEKIYCNLRAQTGSWAGIAWNDRPNATSMTTKGRAAMGTSFRIGHFPSPNNNTNKSAMAGIYATEDGTNVSIDLTNKQPVLQGAGAPSTANVINITLNKGETYVFAIAGNVSALNRGRGMIGGLISSDKKIVVNCGSWGGNLKNADVVDIGIDQIVGADKIGKEYVVVRGALATQNNNHERVLIIAHEDNTEVKINGVVVTTIANAGDYYYSPSTKYSTNGSMYIETDKPAYVYQFMMGDGGWQEKTQGMNFVPPISCNTTSFVDNIPFVQRIAHINYASAAITVVSTAGATVTVTADGVNQNIGAPKAVTGSNYVQYKISNLTGNVAVYSTTIALVSIAGQNTASGYGGYFSGFVETEFSEGVSCLPGYLFEPNGRSGDYRWFKDGVVIPGETNDSLFASETGDYTFERTLAGCVDTSEIISAVGVNQFSFDGDTALCFEDSVQLSIIGSGFDSLSWETGEEIASVFIKTADTTDVRIYSDITKECYVDTFVITTELPFPTLSMSDTSFCRGGTATLDAQNTGSTYLWSTSEVSKTIDISESRDYHVAITDTNGCVGRDTMNLTVNSCNTDAAVTKTDGRDDYTPGTTTTYAIVAKNLGPNDFTGGTVSDPLPTGIASVEVSWNATSYGGATTATVGNQIGTLNDVVSIPVGDSVVYSVSIAVPVAYRGDLVNTVTISVDIDTNALNDVATDTDFNGLCLGATTSSFVDQFNTGYKVNVGDNDPNWTIQWINDPAYHVYSASSYATPTSNAIIPAVGMNKAAGVWGDASYPDYLWVCYPWTGANNGPGKHIDVDGDGVLNEYSNINNIVGATGDAVLLKFSKSFEMTAAQVAASELSFSIAADNNIMDIIVNGVSQGPKILGSYQLVPHTITQGFQVGTNTVEIIVNSGPGYAGMMIANSTIKAVDSVSLVTTDPPLPCAPVSVDITDSLWTVGSINIGVNTYFTDAGATAPYNSPTTADSGSYYIVTTTPLGCSDTAKINVDEHPNPDVTLREDTSFCEGGSVVLEAGTAINLIWRWTGGVAAQSITVDTTGVYKLVVTDVNNCSDSDSVKITVHPLPIVMIGPDSIICEGDSVALDAQNSGSTYSWNTGELSQQISIKDAGIYGVEVIDENTCFGSDSMELTFHPNPVVDVGKDTEICEGQTVTVDAGSWVTTVWGDTQSTSTVLISATTKAYVDVLDTNGCFGSDTIQVTVNPFPVVDLGNDTTICIRESLTLDAGNPTLAYLWNTGQTSQTIVVSLGEYKVTVQDSIGCATSDSTIISVEEITDPFIQDYPFCEGDSSELWADNNVNDYTITWLGLTSDPTYFIKETGTYQSEVTGEYCSEYFDVVGIKTDTPDVYIEKVTLRDKVCFDNDVMKLGLQGINLDQLDVLWSTGESEHQITTYEAGVYSVEAIYQTCSTHVEIEVEEFCPANLFVPNAFTPDGGGLNDVWMPKGYNLLDYEMRIFNRWGQLLFTSNDLHVGWNGTFKGGEVQQDVYVYKIYYSHELESGLMEEEYLVGTVTLVR
ncbi:MAG: gliding motility-associated-like protein/uncharacterized repeat protein (TIGR01451 family) [Saprospiraceae bacterium]|jgi:gliding motility-associated-like protein/uncharacterized repeat protein (TIGR01451 family)